MWGVCGAANPSSRVPVTEYDPSDPCPEPSREAYVALHTPHNWVLSTAPGFMEAGWFKSDLHRGGLTGELPVVVCLSFCRWDVPDGFKQPVMVEPGHPFQGCQLHRFPCWPGPPMNHLRLVQPVDRLGQGVDAPMSRGGCQFPKIGQNQRVEGSPRFQCNK